MKQYFVFFLRFFVITVRGNKEANTIFTSKFEKKIVTEYFCLFIHDGLKFEK